MLGRSGWAGAAGPIPPVRHVAGKYDIAGQITQPKMTGHTLSLLTNTIFLGIAVYVYLLSRGLVKPSDEDTRQRLEEFRKDNAGWMRILALLLGALMLVNILFEVRDMLAGG